MIKRISHLGFAVKDLERAIELYENLFGARVAHRFESAQDRMRAATIRVGDLEIELMEPTQADSPVGKFIAKRGEGIHHVCYKVEDVAGALRRADDHGIETIDKQPRVGAGGLTRVGFLHPKSTLGVLTELEEDVH